MVFYHIAFCHNFEVILVCTDNIKSDWMRVNKSILVRDDSCNYMVLANSFNGEQNYSQESDQRSSNSGFFYTKMSQQWNNKFCYYLNWRGMWKKIMPRVIWLHLFVFTDAISKISWGCLWLSSTHSFINYLLVPGVLSHLIILLWQISWNADP